MARRVIDWITAALRDPYTEPQVHFHQGPYSAPMVCHDSSCESPRMHVENG
jgi:hypothetical protein